MKIKKLLALLLCLCLVLPLCSAAFATGNEGDPTPAAATATPAADPAEPAAATPTPETPAADPAATPAPAADLETPAADPTEAPTCNCGAEGDAAHAETCPLYVAPTASTATPAAPADPTPAAEIDTAAIVERLLAAATWQELAESVEALTDAEIAALSEEQIAAIEARFDALEPDPLPPVVIDETADAPVESEIIRPSRNYSNAAPFRDPVSGPAKMRLMAARAANAENSGMEIDKQAVKNADGSYTITLEAYATGAKVITEVTEEIPTDIVLVLDQSGSMTDPIGTVRFDAYEHRNGGKYTNDEHYQNRHNGGDANLYYPLGDGSYASVSVTVEQKLSYKKITDGRNNDDGGWGESYTNYWDNRNNLYALVKGEYAKVTVNREWISSGIFRGYYKYTYTLPDGTGIATSDYDSGEPTFTGTDDNVLYLGSVDESQNVYTYTYTDSTGATQIIGTSTGANTQFPTTLYERVVNQNAGGSRLSALKSALNSFTSAVNTKAAGEDGALGTADDINHRIAVVGFAAAEVGNPGNWTNSEIFVGATQTRYDNLTTQTYLDALQDMSTQDGQSNVSASIGALDASGGTNTDLGLEMANSILNANPVASGEKRNRVIIVFTDGVPGRSGFDDNVASRAIGEAGTAKSAGVTVYTVGIFSGADASSAGNSNGTETEKANWFMQSMSSNNGTPRNPSYYLSAADSGTLSNIFKQISDNIETGGSSSTLTEEAVIKDIVSPQFSLPAGATASNITLETYHCTGKDATTGEYTWNKNADAMGATATVSGSNVSVTGFNFSKNYVGTVTENGVITGYHGDKLVITFTVNEREGFLGGNGVFTNTSAGVYENGTATDPILTFDRPAVNVPIPAVTVTAQDKAVYLLNGLTADALRSGAVVKVGDVPLDLTKAGQNFGLEPWQTEYVDITVKIQDKDGNVITSDLSDLTEDQTYTISVTVTPKPVPAGVTPSGEAATEQTNSGNAKISVYKPELTAADSTIYLGQTADYAANFDAATGIVWKHGTTVADTTTMGPAPVLTVGYNPTAGAFTQDTDVKMTTAIGQNDVTAHTTFINDTDDHDNGTDKHQFTVFVKTCSLTVTKAGSGSMTNGTETHIFTVTGPNGISLKIAVQGNGSKTIVGLPVGEYVVTEDTNWSWRYADGKTGSATLEASETGAHKTVTITNANPTTKWLSGDNFKVNTFAASAQQSAAAPMTELKVAGAAPAILPDGTVQLGINE